MRAGRAPCAAPARYTVEAQPPASTDSALLAQLEAQGALGFRTRGPMFFADGLRWVYERDAAQSSRFTYAARDAVSTGAALLEQANAEGAQDRGYLGELFFPSSMRNLYFAATACTGPPCEARGPFDP